MALLLSRIRNPALRPSDLREVGEILRDFGPSWDDRRAVWQELFQNPSLPLLILEDPSLLEMVYGDLAGQLCRGTLAGQVMRLEGFLGRTPRAVPLGPPCVAALSVPRLMEKNP